MTCLHTAPPALPSSASCFCFSQRLRGAESRHDVARHASAGQVRTRHASWCRLRARGRQTARAVASDAAPKQRTLARRAAPGSCATPSPLRVCEPVAAPLALSLPPAAALTLSVAGSVWRSCWWCTQQRADGLAQRCEEPLWRQEAGVCARKGHCSRMTAPYFGEPLRPRRRCALVLRSEEQCGGLGRRCGAGQPWARARDTLRFHALDNERWEARWVDTAAVACGGLRWLRRWLSVADRWVGVPRWLSVHSASTVASGSW